MAFVDVSVIKIDGGVLVMTHLRLFLRLYEPRLIPQGFLQLLQRELPRPWRLLRPQL